MIEVTISICVVVEIEESEVDRLEEKLPYDEVKSLFVRSMRNFLPEFTYRFTTKQKG